MGTLKSIAVILVLAVLYLLPAIVFIRKTQLLQNRTFRNFLKAINGTVCSYLVIMGFLAIPLFAFYPLIHDPQYPSPDDHPATATVIMVFLLSLLFIFLPLMAIANLINFVRDRSGKKLP